MYTLVVVDMQGSFPSANGSLVKANCLREIRKAKADGADIIFLEFMYNDPTHKELIRAAGSRHYVLEKDDDDGSLQVQKKVFQQKLYKHFRVCGVNTDCCVHSTVRGLTARFPMSTVEVVTDACASDWNHSWGIEKMRKLDNVKLV